ncbi:PQQ-binding-like beta-propeller repeat protein [Streptomyces sp. NBC_01619]|uniref:protein kinase domain-containing protein n=1 Tax=Streptomyces sp. NBC_01619 TaxID=2975901 RepID=UPI00224EA817|nr:PQQ-binding-like beta-propeller repeat protein [Streptomyces sp. NBC_01619]MCX4508776.1 PQQ-binding-like beta-propeller repeat protein [Streptomyces sp. NBC_01619]
MLSPLTHDDPRNLSRYLLLARLGSGGMGTVYLARNPGGRTVALKTMHAAIAADPAARTRFRLETDAARIIGSQHGAAVVDADPLAETPWLATEYVLGPPLDDAVTLCGPLPEPSVRALGAALVGALGQLHSSDVVHRDLKPSNVMVTAYGPKVIDFGIARAAGDDRLTRMGVAAGTPAFMSPEQATGQEHTSAGDVFALAGVLVYAAAGHGPFGTGQAADLLYRVRYAEPDLTGAPEALAPILARCLAKDPAERPGTARLAAELHDGRGDFADHLPDDLLAEIARRATEVWHYAPYRLPAPNRAPLPETVPDHGPPSGMSRRRLLSVSGGSALAAAGGGVGIWAWLRGPDGGRPGVAGGTEGPTAAPQPGADQTTAPADKRQPWRKRVTSVKDEPVLAPLPVGAIVVVMTGDGLLALAARSGERRWLVESVKEPRHVHTDGKQIHVLLPGGTNGHQLSLHTIDPVGGRISPTAPFAKSGNPVQQGALLRVADGTAYLAVRSGGIWSIRAFDARTGREKWSTPTRAYNVTGSDDLVVTALAGNMLILRRAAEKGDGLDVNALDVRTGRLVWETTVPGEQTGGQTGEPADTSAFAPNSLVADDRHVYVGGSRVQALRLRDGAVAWAFGAGRAAEAYGPPALRDGVVYAAERNRGVVALGATDGKLRWAAKTGDRPDLRVPPVTDGEHVFVTAEGTVRAVTLDTHAEDWSFTPSSSSLCLIESEKRLVQTDGRNVTAIRLDYSSLL